MSPAALNSGKSGVKVAFTKLLKQMVNDVEFDLPHWVHSTPAQYISIKRNIYVTKKAKHRVADDGIFCSCVQSPGLLGVCGRYCHCGLLQSSCSRNCKCGNLCLNKPFQCRGIKKMKLIQTDKCGAGVVADEKIKKGEFVIEYVGEVIDDKTCEERLWKMKHKGETNFYLCEISKDMVIDATYKGNMSRYMNHSCSPNTEMQKWIIDGETRIGIFANRDIACGEHLTYDYQFVQFGADQDCHCGSVTCRQTLGVKPSKPKSSSFTALRLVAYQVCQNAGSRSRKMLKSCGNKQKVSGNCINAVIKISHGSYRRDFGIIMHYDNHSRKHKIMFEDRSVEFLDISKTDWELLST